MERTWTFFDVFMYGIFVDEDVGIELFKIFYKRGTKRRAFRRAKSRVEGHKSRSRRIGDVEN